MKSIVASVLLVCFSLSISAQWTTTLQVDNTNLYRLFKFGENQIVATAEWSNVIYLNEEGQSIEEKQLATYGFLYSAYTAQNDNWYLGGGCYFVIEDACPGNMLHKSADQGITWERVKTEATFTGFGNVVGILPTKQSDELIIVNEYEGVFRINEKTATATAIEIDPNRVPNNFLIGIASPSGKWTVGFSFVEAPSVSKTVYYESEDNGQSWQEIRLDNPDEFIRSLSYRPDDQLQIITSRMRVYLYNNGQTNYHATIPMNSPAEQVRTQAIPTKLVSYVSTFDQVEQTGYIYRTKDGGQSWGTDAQFDSLFIDHMVFTDQHNGFAIANYRNILKRAVPNTISPDNSIAVFPNPTQDRLCIDLAFSPITKFNITIHDAIGRMIYQGDISSPWIDVQDLVTGIYFLSISNNKREWEKTVKFCKY